MSNSLNLVVYYPEGDSISTVYSLKDLKISSSYEMIPREIKFDWKKKFIYILAQVYPPDESNGIIISINVDEIPNIHIVWQITNS